jgi:hypothetical protein
MKAPQASWTHASLRTCHLSMSPMSACTAVETALWLASTYVSAVVSYAASHFILSPSVLTKIAVF